jgi:hypothetical protein
LKGKGRAHARAWRACRRCTDRRALDSNAGRSTGRLKPYAIGTFFNARPLLINAGLLIYQISCSSVRLLTLKDGGDRLAFDGDDPDYATLAAATISAGHYRTCLALGLLRAGGRELLIFTVDGQGDNDTINGHTFPSQRAELIRRIATGRGAFRLDDSEQIDGAAFVDFNNKQGGACGYYWDGSSNVTKGQAMTQCMAGCLGYWFMRLSGLLAIGQIEDPATQSAYVSFSFPAKDSGEVRVAEPAMTSYLAPVQTTIVGYARNWTPLQPNQIVGIVDLTTSGILQAPSAYAASNDQYVTNAYPTAPIVQVDGGYALQADAQAEADRQQTLRLVRRERYSIDVNADPFGDWLGRIINIANYGRLGMTESKNFLCVGQAVNNGPAVTLQLWG